MPPSRAPEPGSGSVLGRHACHLLQGLSRAALIACCLAATPVAAQATTQTATQAQSQALPDAAAAIETFNTVAGWVAQGQVPPEHSGEGLPPVHVASVAIRYQGRVVARGVGASTTPDPTRVLLAARQAISSLPPSLRARPAELALSLELSGPPIPAPGDQAAELTLGFSPGVDGLLITLGDRAEAVPPATLLERSVGPAAVLAGLVTRAAGGDVTDSFEPPATLRERGYGIYRFRVVHLAQPAAGMGPQFLHRSGRVVAEDELDAAGLRRFVAGLVDHLAARRWPGVEPYGMVGTPDASTGISDPNVASPAEQALAAYALARAGSVAGGTEAFRTRVRTVIADLVADLDEHAEGEPDVRRDLAACCALIALRATLGSNDEIVRAHPDLFTVARAALDAAFPHDAFNTAVPPPAKGMVAWALAVEAHRTNDAPLQHRARAAVNEVIRATPAQQLPGQSPWLAWAALALPDGADLAPILREARSLVWRHQLQRADLTGADRDLAGGVVFTSGTTPLPTAQAVRVFASAAAMLTDERFTPGTAADGEWGGELIRVLRTARFVRQLAADPDATTLYARPERAAWGVRAALWDQRQPSDASALALVGLCDLLDALAERG